MKEKIINKKTSILILSFFLILLFCIMILFRFNKIKASSLQYSDFQKNDFSKYHNFANEGVESKGTYFNLTIGDFVASMNYIIENDSNNKYSDNTIFESMKEESKNGKIYWRKLLVRSKKSPLILNVYLNDDNMISKIQMTYNYLDYDWNYSVLQEKEYCFKDYYNFLYILLMGYDNLSVDYYEEIPQIYNQITLTNYTKDIKTGKKQIKTNNAEFILEYDKKGNVTLNILPIGE